MIFDADTVRRHMKLPAGDDDLLQAAVDAVTAFVSRTPAGRTQPWSDDVVLAAVMLAARYVRRRSTPSGVESTPDGAVYVARRDGDVDLLLRIGSYMKPAVG